MNTTITKPRINYIDSARGLAILFVLIGHVCTLKHGLGQYFYSFHMPMFFIISGMLLSYNDSWKNMTFYENFIKKVKSFMYPYIIFSILSILYIWFSKDLNSAINSIFIFISLEGISSLWFLPALFIGELVFILIMKHFSKIQTIISFILILIITGLFCTLGAKLGLISVTGVETYLMKGLNIINRALISSIFIAIGYYVIKIKLDEIDKKILFISSIIFLFINLCLFRYNYVNLHYSAIGNPILYYINSLTGSFGFIGISKLFLDKIKILIFYGKNSLILFVTHGNLGIIHLVEKITLHIPKSFRWMSMVILLILLETIIVLIINKYFKILINYKEFETKILKRLIKN